MGVPYLFINLGVWNIPGLFTNVNNSVKLKTLTLNRDLSYLRFPAYKKFNVVQQIRNHYI